MLPDILIYRWPPAALKVVNSFFILEQIQLLRKPLREVEGEGLGRKRRLEEGHVGDTPRKLNVLAPHADGFRIVHPQCEVPTLLPIVVVVYVALSEVELALTIAEKVSDL